MTDLSPEDIETEWLDPWGIRITIPDGREFEFVIPTLFRDMNPNELRELYCERIAMDGVEGLSEEFEYQPEVTE